MIPDTDHFYNEKVINFQNNMRVRYPEMYFLICINGLTKDNLDSYKQRYSCLEKMNIVETNNIDQLLHTCCELDVAEDELLKEALEKKSKIYTFRMFDGACKEDMDIYGTPEDDILAECVQDKFSTRENYKYLAPPLALEGEGLLFNGFKFEYLNKPLGFKYNPSLPILYVRIYQTDKTDTCVKLFGELQR